MERACAQRGSHFPLLLVACPLVGHCHSRSLPLVTRHARCPTDSVSWASIGSDEINLLRARLGLIANRVCDAGAWPTAAKVEVTANVVVTVMRVERECGHCLCHGAEVDLCTATPTQAEWGWMHLSASPLPPPPLSPPPLPPSSSSSLTPSHDAAVKHPKQTPDGCLCRP